MKFFCKSVLGGWQTFVSFPPNEDGFPIGPVFNKATDLWKWQETALKVLP